MFKNYLRSLILTILIILGGSIITTLLSYFTNLTTLTNILRVIIILISILIPTFILGTKSLKKGYLEGLKYGLILIILSLIINIIMQNKFSLDIIIYYVIILTSSMLGSMLGINFKKDK